MRIEWKSCLIWNINLKYWLRPSMIHNLLYEVLRMSNLSGHEVGAVFE